MDKLEQEAAEWLVRCEGRDCTPDRLAALEAWLAADARHQAAYLRLKAGWDQTGQRFRRLRPRGGGVNPDLLDSIADSLAGKDRAPAPEFSGRRRVAILCTLAAVAVAIAAGAGFWTMLGRSGWETYATDFGGFQRLVLSDGSAINMNTDSLIRVRITSVRRQIVLQRGEALFTVARDPRRPFEVLAGASRVRALGTTFSVRLEQKKGVQVIVTEGRVAIDPPEPHSVRTRTLPESLSTLSAGETVTLSPKQLHVAKIDHEELSHRLGWVEGRLWFEGQTLEQAVAEFNRYNRRQIVISDPGIAKLAIGGGFESTDPESFIVTLEYLFGVRAFAAGVRDDEVIRLVGTDGA